MATNAATPQYNAQPRQRITFRQGVTQQVTIETEGVLQPGIAGDEYRYTASNHRIMWVPPEVHHAIQASGADLPATYEITKGKSGWLTVHLADEPPAPQPIASAPRRAPTPAAAAPREPQPRDLPAAPPKLPGLQDEQPYSASMYTSLCAAIRVAAAAEEFARSIGRAIAFETGDVRAIAATLFIHATQGSR
jgi:hypothetical protein